jgi:mono/diheme cytochrome c family protein
MRKSAQICSKHGRIWSIATLAVASTMLVGSAFADAGAALPAGPKENLVQWAGDDAAALMAVLGRSLSVDEWRAELADLADDAAIEALAGYLALNAPVEAGGDDVTTIVAALPLDGKELFVDTCLACHGGESYFLQRDMGEHEWMAIFDAPYHRRLLTEGVERETFASYAAATTPLVLEDVPEELVDARE